MSEEVKRPIKTVKLEQIEPIPINLRKMSDEEFNLLVQSIRETGFVEPIQVVELPNGRYRIVNGQHRYDALRVLGVEEAPVVVVARMCGEGEVPGEDGCWTEVRYWMEAIRLNNIRGDFDPVLLAEKILEIREKTKKLYDLDELKRKLGFAGKNTLFDKVFRDVKKALPPEARAELEKRRKEAQTVEDLSRIIHEIMRKYGSTLKYRFIVFSFGGKEHVLVQCDAELWNKIAELRRLAVEKERSLTALLNAVITYERIYEVVEGGESGEEEGKRE